MILISKIVQLYFCYFNFYKLWFWYYKYYESKWLTKPRYLTSIRKISAHIVNCKIHFVILISKFLDRRVFLCRTAISLLKRKPNTDKMTLVLSWNYFIYYVRCSATAGSVILSNLYALCLNETYHRCAW